MLATGCYITPVIVENTKNTQKKYNPQNMKNTTLEREKVAYKREMQHILVDSRFCFFCVRKEQKIQKDKVQSVKNRAAQKVPDKVWEALVQSKIKFNRVPEKVPENVGEALVQSQVRFSTVPEKVPEKVWDALVQSRVKFNREGSGEGLGDFGAEPGHVQQNSGDGSGEGLGGFGAEPGQVQQG